MKIHEYQAKQILDEFGVPVPTGRVAMTAAAAKTIASELGGRVVVKAQIHAGGRGKGGGVKLANSPAEAERVAGQILGMQLVTHQTGPEGQKVKSVLVEEQMQIERELYLSVILDSAIGTPVIIADGRVLALAAKFTVDDNALYRHPEIRELRDLDEEDPLEVQAQELGINNYVKLDGNIGCVVNGAGLAMSTMDVIKYAGGEP